MPPNPALVRAGSLAELEEAPSGWFHAAVAGGTVYVKTGPGKASVTIVPAGAGIVVASERGAAPGAAVRAWDARAARK